MSDMIFIKKLEVECIIGIYKWERTRRQKVSIDLGFPADIAMAAKSDRIQDAVNYKAIAKTVLGLATESRFKLIESLAEKIASTCMKRFSLPFITVKVSKPGAIRFSENVGVEITRYSKGLEKSSGDKVLAYICLGSNQDRRRSIGAAIRRLKTEYEAVKISHVYECSALGGGSQRPFYNAMMCIQTDLSPHKLRSSLRSLEMRLGRKRKADKYAPRKIDLDIVFYDNQLLRRASLSIPHPEAHSAAYILLPMAEIAPTFVHPVMRRSIIELLGEQLDSQHLFRRV